MYVYTKYFSRRNSIDICRIVIWVNIMNLKCNLEELIKKSGLRKDFIANKLGVSTRQIRNYELQKNFIPMDKAIMLTELLNCSLDDLYTKIENYSKNE